MGNKGGPDGEGARAGEFADTETSRAIIVRLAIATHKALRIRVAEEDTSIQKWVEALIEQELGVRKPS